MRARRKSAPWRLPDLTRRIWRPAAAARPTAPPLTPARPTPPSPTAAIPFQGYTFAPWYACDPAVCVAPCTCASALPPGGLLPEQTPQFVIITHDDALTSNAYENMLSITGGANNTNGCPVPATWFVTVQNSNCTAAFEAFTRGHELATHTVTHPALVPGYPRLAEEVLGARDYLEKFCRIPAAEVSGFRAPFLISNPEQRAFLAQQGFKWDSSLSFPSMGRGGSGERVWPFSLDYGAASPDCAPEWQAQCGPEERLPGFFEVPLAELEFNGGGYTMDPGKPSQGNTGLEAPVFDVLKANLELAYRGNRAPMPVFVHEPWFNETANTGAKAFIDYALTVPNVFFVTIGQLVEWMKAPVPAAETAAWLRQRCVSGSMAVALPPPPAPVAALAPAPAVVAPGVAPGEVAPALPEVVAPPVLVSGAGRAAAGVAAAAALAALAAL